MDDIFTFQRENITRIVKSRAIGVIGLISEQTLYDTMLILHPDQDKPREETRYEWYPEINEYAFGDLGDRYLLYDAIAGRSNHGGKTAMNT